MKSIPSFLYSDLKILATVSIKLVSYSLKTHVETIRFRKKYTFFYKTAILTCFRRLTSEGGYTYLPSSSLKTQ